MVWVEFLGSGDAFGSNGRFQACLRLRADSGDGGNGDNGDVLVDCGATSLVAMKRAGVDPNQVGWVLVSHLHGDHFGGLPFLVLDGQFSGRQRPLVVAGPPGLADRVRAAMEVFYPGSTEVQRRFETRFVELAPQTETKLGPVTVTGYPVAHPSGAPAYALRVVCGDKVLAYSGDTSWSDQLVDVAAGADLLVCEAYTYTKDVPHHLSHQRLAAERGRLSCDRIVLTHLGPEMLLHAAESPFECATDGTVLEL